MKYTSLLLAFLFFGQAFAQTSEQDLEKSIQYFNRFNTLSHQEIDSSFFYADQLARLYPELLSEAIHNNFAQYFLNSQDHGAPNAASPITRKPFFLLLEKMKNGKNRTLARTVAPLAFWVQLQTALADSNQVNRLAGTFRQTVLPDTQPYLLRHARYALLIYRTLLDHPSYESLARNLFDSTLAMLTAGLPAVEARATDDRQSGESRAWHRYLYAYCHYLKGQEALRKGQRAAAKPFLRLAYQFRPDAADADNSRGYFYERVLLGTQDLSFAEEYFRFLADESPQEALPVLAELTVNDPKQLPKLKAYYERHFPSQRSFENYWTETLNQALEDARAFTLTKLDKSTFSLQANEGKWILLDFWGTWCGPCVQEMPEMEKFYTEVVQKNSGRIALLTIACQDREDFVQKFLTKNNYTFPVAMSDRIVETIFPVPGFPTKILITPQGKFLKIPFGEDWLTLVRSYSGL